MRTLCTILSLCMMALLLACEKDAESKLFGKWQLMQVETDGNIQKVDTVFYNFQHSLFMYQIIGAGAGGYRYGYNVLEGENTLLLELTDYPKPVQEFLPYTDWKDRKRTFLIETLTAKKLVLRSEGKTYTFRCF